MELSSLSLYAVIAIVSLLYYLVRNHYEFWKKRGIPYEEPYFLVGCLKGFRTTVGMFELFSSIYKRFKGTGPFVGVFLFNRPAAVILDLDLIKNILIKDFNKFDDRGLSYSERVDPLSAHLFVLDGAKWKPLRGKLTPTFTSGKMKFMFPTMIRIGEEFMKSLEKESSINTDIDMGDILARFTTDVIGTCAFGIDCNSLKDPKAEFREMGKMVFKSEPTPIRFIITEGFPKLADFLKVKRIRKDISEFYTRIVKETVDFREKNNVRRNDFMDLLIDLKNTKYLRSKNGEELKALTMNEITAQSFLFFLAGFETSSTTMGFALYELAQHQDIQDKLRLEINSVLQKYDGEMTYEGFNEMGYLDKIINETLRKYSPAATLRRRAKEDYATADPKYVIPRGTTVVAPIFCIHNDPEIFTNPEVFDPERFSPEEISKRHPMTWLPFGEGPRNCIGLRFGLMQTRVGLSMLIKNFKISISKDTPIPMKFSKKALVLASEKPIILKVEKL